MSLDWSIKEVEDPESLLTAFEAVVTNVLVMHALVAGLGENWTLDADYAPEFYARVKLYEDLEGAIMMISDGTPRRVTWADVRRRIGMRVNVAPITRAKFVKKIVGARLDQTVRECKAVAT